VCGVRGEGLVNAFSAHEKFWQERHIVKDYIMENQPEGSNWWWWMLATREA
jgi:hypothetical protein